ncbi:uncharacterized protein [Littorina saxatilis]|uniref:uncharacterized protein n=1 Tax=Littorina saxatilis TaxID=31220 RepID=UPI0038B42950
MQHDKTTRDMGLRVFLHAALCLLLNFRANSGQLIHDPCDVYGTLVDLWRDPEAGADPTHCDDGLATGWYTFRLDKDPAVIPTQCLQDNTCGARLSLHVDLEGQQLPQVGDNISAVLCGSYNVLGAIDCCVQRQSVVIKRCSDDVIIYNLRPQSVCPAAVCATRLRDVIPAQYLAKPGDRPQSLPAVTMTTSAETETPSASSDTTSSDTTSSGLPDEITRRLGTMEASSSTTSVTTATASTGQASPSSPATSTIPPATSGSPRVLTSSVSVNSLGDNATDSVSSLSNDESSLPDDESFTHNRSEVATTTDSLDARSENDTLMTLHNTTMMTSLTPFMTSVAPVMTVVTSATAPPSAEPRTATVTSVPTAGVASTFPGTTTAIPQGASTPLPPQRSSLPSTSTGPPSLPPQSSQAVRFVLRGAFKEDLFLDQLEHFARNFSNQLRQSDVSSNVTDISMTSHPSRDNITVVDVDIKDPLTNDTVPAAHLLDLMRNSNFTQQISIHTHMIVEAMCAALDRCDVSRTGSVIRSKSLFKQNQAVFIAVIAMATLCLLILLLGLLYVRCRRQGTWVLSPDHEEKGLEPGGVESPMTDAQITRGEEEEGEGEGVVTANGHERAHTPDDIPAADEDNGWVVPLDQAPAPASDWLAPKSEDTQF